jgi:hypothetical protein
MSNRVRSPNVQHRFDIVESGKVGTWQPQLGSVMARNAHIAARKFAARIKRSYKQHHRDREIVEPGDKIDLVIDFTSSGYVSTYGNRYKYQVTIIRKYENELMESARIGPGIQRDKKVEIDGHHYSLSIGNPERDELGKTIPEAKTVIVSEYVYRVKSMDVTETGVARRRRTQRAARRDAARDE